jgi:dihydrofolate reductase
MISGIVAMSQNRVIGREGALPWRLPEDLKRFRAVTWGHPVIMGRKTFESIGKVLPGRRNVIISRQSGMKIDGADVVGSLSQAFEVCGSEESEIFVIGGGEIYRAALPQMGRIYLTLIHQDIEGDAYFPELTGSEWIEVSREERVDPIRFSLIVLERKSN